MTHTVMSRIKARLISIVITVEADVRARLLFTPGFYSNQVHLRVSTQNEAVPTVYLENEACFQKRLRYETGFNTRHYGT